MNQRGFKVILYFATLMTYVVLRGCIPEGFEVLFMWVCYYIGAVDIDDFNQSESTNVAVHK